MDAIERRLAVLEAHSLPDVEYLVSRGWEQMPTPGPWSAEGQWWRGWIGTSKHEAVQYAALKLQRKADLDADPSEFSCAPAMRVGEEWRFRKADGWHFSRYVPDDEVERARERASLADDAAGPWPGERIDWEVEAARAQMRANRFEESLRALLAILNGGNPLAMIDAADITALIEGCLAGGTITASGLKDG